jgi:hypothetical protein
MDMSRCRDDGQFVEMPLVRLAQMARHLQAGALATTVSLG